MLIMVTKEKWPLAYAWFALIILIWTGCHDSIDKPAGDLTNIPYSPVPYTVNIPTGFPALEQPLDNPMTVDGVFLGRELFYDPIFSIDSTVSCSSCHQQKHSFTDGLDRSIGVNGQTKRSSMNLMNVGFTYHGLFWDGRAATLEQLALIPIEDQIEMAESWSHVEQKLKRHPTYPADFRRAFGISDTSMINRDLATKAVAQFLRSITSGYNSRYDRFVRGEIFLDENEYNGYLMFFNIDPGLPDAQCGHCHNAPVMATNDFFNNGLQEAPDLESIPDKGRGLITGDPADNGKFKPPTLRNIALTAPYMHDGRFKTLEEVLDHYASGGKDSPNKSSFMYNLHLNESQKADIIAFLKTLTDSSVVTNPAYSSPF
jgi:cytochrome c peroxidase